jgi:hypothetical protein
MMHPVLGSVMAAAAAAVAVHTHHQCVQRCACAQLEEVGRPGAGEVLPDGIRCSLVLQVQRCEQWLAAGEVGLGSTEARIAHGRDAVSGTAVGG